MTTVNKNKIKELLYAEILYELHITQDKLKWFNSKYQMEFESFEAKIKNTENENFSEWDDYIEWKGFFNNYKYLIEQKKAIEDENIRVA